MHKYFFMLGADDPEMRAIESLLKAHNQPYRHATINGRRVHSGNAYAADPVMDWIFSTTTTYEGYETVYIECGETGQLSLYPPLRRIDHHREGDPGYDLPPAQYWEASSIGQLHTLLGIEPTNEMRLLAAMDHCFGAAIRGECPGVSSNDVLALKCSGIAARMKIDDAVVYGRIQFFRDELAASPNEIIGTQSVKDLRRHDLGPGYSLDLLTAQVAATMSGHAALLRHHDYDEQPDEKWTLTGNVTPETIIAFKNVWAPANGLVRVYGVPGRGYAGGYTG